MKGKQRHYSRRTFLKKAVKPHAGKEIHIVLDNLSPHTTPRDLPNNNSSVFVGCWVVGCGGVGGDEGRAGGGNGALST